MDAPSATPWNDRLRQERIRRNWRQQDLADHLGTTVVTIQRWERGSQRPGAYFRLKLCALFGTSAEELGLVDVNPSPPTLTQEEGSETVQIPFAPAEAAGIWTVPYLRNPHFTGRDDLLERLAQQLSSEHPREVRTTQRAVLSQPQAVKGLGGIGKTQIAVEYTYRAREQGRYTHLLWINAASEEAIITSFQTLAERLPTFPARDEKDQHKLIAAILRWLEACQEPWLLIFDNADEPALVQPYLPQQGQGSVLLTTRAHAVGWLANSIEVDQMGLMEGTRFLLHRAGRLSASDEESNEASNIVIAFDGFPLALDQAGAYIEETGCSFGDYLQLCERHRATLLARRGKQATNYPASVATAWDISFQQIEQTQPAAAELLRLCAFLSPDHIPEELITEGVAHWPALLKEAVSDPLRFNELLEALLAFSLVKRHAQDRLLSLHRLVQVVQLDRIDAQQQCQWAERVVYAVNTLFPADPQNEINSWSQCLRYLEQVQACDTLIQQYHLQLPEAAELLERAGVYLRERASYSIAEPLFQRALVIAEQQLSSQHIQVASLLNNLAILYSKQGKKEQAGNVFQQVLSIRERALGPDHPEVASSLNNLANIYGEQGRYTEAVQLFQQALHIRERTLGPDHLHISSSLNNLAVTYHYLGKRTEAEPLYRRALLIRKRALGSNHPIVAQSLENLANFYQMQGRFAEAEPLCQEALRIREQALGSDHPDLAPPLNILADLYRKQGKYEEAESLSQWALRVNEQAFGPDHHRVAHSLNGLANLFFSQEKYEEAEPLYQRTLRIREQALGLDHPDTAETLHDFAVLREAQGKHQEAAAMYQQALAIREQVLGARHPKTSDTRERLRVVLQTLGKMEEAAALETTRLDQAEREDEQVTYQEQ